MLDFSPTSLHENYTFYDSVNCEKVIVNLDSNYNLTNITPVNLLKLLSYSISVRNYNLYKMCLFHVNNIGFDYFIKYLNNNNISKLDIEKWLTCGNLPFNVLFKLLISNPMDIKISTMVNHLPFNQTLISYISNYKTSNIPTLKPLKYSDDPNIKLVIDNKDTNIQLSDWNDLTMYEKSYILCDILHSDISLIFKITNTITLDKIFNNGNKYCTIKISGRDINITFDSFVKNIFTSETVLKKYVTNPDNRKDNYREQQLIISKQFPKKLEYIIIEHQLNVNELFFANDFFNDTESVLNYSMDNLNSETIQNYIREFIDKNRLYGKNNEISVLNEKIDLIDTNVNIFRENIQEKIDKLLQNKFGNSSIQLFKQYVRETDKNKLFSNEILTLIVFYELLYKRYGDILDDIQKYHKLSSQSEKKNLFSSIVHTCLQRPSYLKNTSGKIKTNSLKIWFEREFGFFGRRDQHELVKSIISTNCELTCNYDIYQLIMGSGKSAFIAPLLSLLLCTINLYPIHVVPDYLLTQTKETMSILNNFGITTTELEFDKTNINTTLTNYIVSSSELKKIILKAILSNRFSAYKRIKDKFEHCFMIYDEVDDISNPFTTELNFPIGSKNIFDKEEELKLLFNILLSIYITPSYNEIDNEELQKKCNYYPHFHTITKLSNDEINLKSELFSNDGKKKFEFQSTGYYKNAKEIGYKVGEELLKKAGPNFTVEGN